MRDGSNVSEAVAASGVLRAGLVGRGIGLSRTPAMHVSEGRRLGLRYEYRLHDFDALGLVDGALPAFVGALRAGGYAGFNVTHPFKESIIACLDGLNPDAARIGAVNTVVLRDGKATGYNTDCWGFAESLRQGAAGLALDEVLVIGAGGAGRAVAEALLGLGAERIAVVDTDVARMARLSGQLRERLGEQRVPRHATLQAATCAAIGIVNATPMGMAKYPGMPVDPAWLRSDLWVADVVYFPEETELLLAARRAGCRTLSGVGMAIFQAVRAFELITGRAADAGFMARHFSDG